MIQSASVVLAVSVLSLSSASLSCVCSPRVRNIFEKIDRVDLVLDGKLDSVFHDSSNGNTSMYFKPFKVVSIGISIQPSRIKIETGKWTGCGFQMAVGERAIVFAWNDTAQSAMIYRTGLCDRNIVNPTQAQLDSLGDYESKKRKQDGK